jgi:putative acetyltransferase
MDVREGVLDDPQVQAMLRFHQQDSHATTPATHAFVLDAGALAGADTVFLTAWDDQALAGMAALKDLEPGHAELKSMRTHPNHLRKGVGALLLDRLIAVARARGLTRLSLETGTGESYVAAHALYRRFGFIDAPAFANYPPDSPHNRYMTLALTEAPCPPSS